MAKRFVFTYLFCDDLSAMKRFYGEVLGLDQVWDDGRSLAYMIGDHQLSITADARARPAVGAFAIQPGWIGGTEARTSWSLECDPADFKRVVSAAKHVGATAFRDRPEWVGYWSFPLLDPMGNTVEVTCAVEELGL